MLKFVRIVNSASGYGSNFNKNSEDFKKAIKDYTKLFNKKQEIKYSTQYQDRYIKVSVFFCAYCYTYYSSCFFLLPGEPKNLITMVYEKSCIFSEKFVILFLKIRYKYRIPYYKTLIIFAWDITLSKYFY